MAYVIIPTKATFIQERKQYFGISLLTLEKYYTKPLNITVGPADYKHFVITDIGLTSENTGRTIRFKKMGFNVAEEHWLFENRQDLPYWRVFVFDSHQYYCFPSDREEDK